MHTVLYSVFTVLYTWIHAWIYRCKTKKKLFFQPTYVIFVTCEDSVFWHIISINIQNIHRHIKWVINIVKTATDFHSWRHLRSNSTQAVFLHNSTFTYLEYSLFLAGWSKILLYSKSVHTEKMLDKNTLFQLEAYLLYDIFLFLRLTNL